MAEECAAEGYAGTSVAGVTRRAGVSTASFYRQFKDKRECMQASFEELFGRLLEAIEAACGGEGDPAKKARAGIAMAAGLLSSDPPTARLLALEILAVGREGALLQQDAIERLAEALRRVRGADADSPPPFPSAEWAAAAAMVSLVAKRLAEGESLSAAELEAVYARL